MSASALSLSADVENGVLAVSYERVYNPAGDGHCLFSCFGFAPRASGFGVTDSVFWRNSLSAWLEARADFPLRRYGGVSVADFCVDVLRTAGHGDSSSLALYVELLRGCSSLSASPPVGRSRRIPRRGASWFDIGIGRCRYF